MLTLIRCLFAKPNPAEQAARAIAEALALINRARLIRQAGLAAVARALDTPAQ